MNLPLIAALRPLTTRLLNPITRRFVGWLPGFAVIRYVGRTTGRTYRTPMNVFRRDGDYLFALTYGPDVQWVKNVIAAGGCELEQRGHTVRLQDPRRFSDPTASLMPLPIRFFLRLIRVTEFLRLSPGPGRKRRPGPRHPRRWATHARCLTILAARDGLRPGCRRGYGVDRTPDKVRGGSRRSRLDAVPVKESAETDTSATRQRHLSRRLHRLP